MFAEAEGVRYIKFKHPSLLRLQMQKVRVILNYI
jgi:hypothetical protein